MRRFVVIPVVFYKTQKHLAEKRSKKLNNAQNRAIANHPDLAGM